MSNKFQYAPGLPGYGTQGADGSNGLIGLSMYFCEYDGETQVVAIQSKIVNNEILSPTVVQNIPGYPSRTYLIGDMFVDLNGKVYEIISQSTGNYIYTNSRLNTSTIFTEGPKTNISSVEYTRYSNSFGTDKFLVDSVYTATPVINYAQSPDVADGIYGIGATDFGRIDYVDNSINNYEPFCIWTNTTDVNKPE